MNCSAAKDLINTPAALKTDTSINKRAKTLANDHNYIVYEGTGWDLYTMDNELFYENGGGHYMTIIDFTEDGRPIVTSWGKKLILDVKTNRKLSIPPYLTGIIFPNLLSVYYYVKVDF